MRPSSSLESWPDLKEVAIRPRWRGASPLGWSKRELNPPPASAPLEREMKSFQGRIGHLILLSIPVKRRGWRP
jgi:hypothetical protein